MCRCELCQQVFLPITLTNPREDLNALVRRHIQTVLAASPSKALTTLATDARELIGAGMVTINAKMASLSDELLPSRLVELWSFFWDHILPYVEGVSVIDWLSLSRPKQL